MYLIKNGTVHIGNGEVIENCDVLTEGKLIRKVGCHLPEEGAEVIDAPIYCFPLSN